MSRLNKRLTVNASASGNSHSSVWKTDLHLTPFNIGFGCVVDTTAKFTVQHTFETDVSAGTKFFPHEFVVQASADIDGNYAFPVTGIRLEVSAANTGGVTGTFIQAG